MTTKQRHDEGKPAERRTTGTPQQDADSGAGTGVEAPPEDATRTPASTVVTAEGTVTVPGDAAKQTLPAEGLASSSTNPVAAALARPSAAGTNHSRLLDDDNNPVDPGDVFQVEAGQTFGTATRNVNEEFMYPHSTRPMLRRLATAGERWPLQRIAGFRAAHPLAAAQAAQDPADTSLLQTTTR
jgi:hypothetical protein